MLLTAALCAAPQFTAVVKGGYNALLSESDQSMLPLLEHFQEMTAGAQPAADTHHLRNPSLKEYYTRLIDKYIPGGVLKM